MEKLLETLASQPLALVVFAVVVALIFGVRYLGLWQGQNASPAASAATAQVAAVIVDPTALNHAAGSVDGLTVALTAATVSLRAHTVAVDRLSDKTDQLDGGIDRLRDELLRISAKMP